MINAAAALADLNAKPGDIVAVPKAQMAELLAELAVLQRKPRGVAMFGVTSPAMVAR